MTKKSRIFWRVRVDRVNSPFWSVHSNVYPVNSIRVYQYKHRLNGCYRCCLIGCLSRILYSNTGVSWPVPIEESSGSICFLWKLWRLVLNRYLVGLRKDQMKNHWFKYLNHKMKMKKIGFYFSLITKSDNKFLLSFLWKSNFSTSQSHTLDT